MTTIELEDNLIQQIMKTGHYKSAQKAINSILSEYIIHQHENNSLFDELTTDVGMSDDEVDSLFERNNDTGRPVDL